MREKFTTITFMDYEIIDFQYEIVSKIYNYMKSKNYEVHFIYNEDLNKIKQCINSILDQTIRINKIYLFLIVNNDLQNDLKNIPDYLKDIVIIVPTKDYKENTKIIPMLIKEKESDTIILALDNDIIYGKDFIQVMVDEMIKNDNTVLVDSKKTCILFKTSYFDSKIISEKNFLKNKKIIKYNENYKIYNI